MDEVRAAVAAQNVALCAAIRAGAFDEDAQHRHRPCSQRYRGTVAAQGGIAAALASWVPPSLPVWPELGTQVTAPVDALIVMPEGAVSSE